MYVRIFSEILNSSLMDTSIEARWLFITLLILGDEAGDGIVDMPVSRLAAHAAVSIEQARRGLSELMLADPDSASKAEDGKRIVPLYQDGSERGWVIVNWAKYKEIATEERRREQARKDSAAYRARQKEIVSLRQTTSANNQEPVRPTSAPTETEAETKTEKEGRGRNFVPPTLAEVRQYAREKGYELDAEKFHSHFEARGWQYKKGVPVKKWTSACDNWHKREPDFQRSGKKSNTDTTSQAEIDELFRKQSQQREDERSER